MNVVHFMVGGIRPHRLGWVSLLLGGCMTAGPDYAPPAVVAPTAWTAEATGTVAGGALDATELSQWWSVFDDAILTELVESARRTNRDVKQAEARLRKARAQRGLAVADQLPSASIAASGRRLHGSGDAGSGGTTSTYANSLDASWELDLFGGKRRAVESAEASLDASREALRDVLVSLLAEVALNYVQYRACQASLRIVETNLAAQAETYDITRWRYEAELVTQLDVDQARTSLEQTRAAVPALHTRLDQTEHLLATLLGEPPGNLRVRLNAGPPLVPSAVTELAVGVPADVLRQRPDVRRAERALAAQTAQIGVAAAARYPDLTLSGSIGVEALAIGDLYAAGTRTAQGALTAGLAVFDGGRARQNVAVQTAAQEEALAAYEAAVLVALRDVEDALVAYANEQSRRQALRDAAVAGESAYALARNQYASGLVDFPTVLATQQSLLAVQNTLASCQADLTCDLIRLYKALGGGWAPSPGENDVRTTIAE